MYSFRAYVLVLVQTKHALQTRGRVLTSTRKKRHCELQKKKKKEKKEKKKRRPTDVFSFVVEHSFLASE